MGLDAATSKFLWWARASGVDFSRTVTIGRQMFFPDAATLRTILAHMGVEQDPHQLLAGDGFSEPFLRLLGAQELLALDYSDYEGAEIVHDMNEPIAPEWRQRFSAVFDGGTLEHVFNVPVALRNCMEMVAVGGHFLQANVANNFMGHGFWQFSPELLYRVFTPTNGFRVEAMLLHEVIEGGKWYAVSDPDEVQSRVELCNAAPTYVLTIAKRIDDRPPLTSPPLQSDYVTAWQHANGEQPSASAETAAHASDRPRTLGKSPARRILRSLRKRVFPQRAESWAVAASRDGFRQSYYRPIDENDLLRGVRLG